MRRVAFCACLTAALLLTLTALCAAVVRCMTDVSLFEEGLRANVDFAAMGADDSAAASFAEETITYLRGDKDAWEPRVITSSGVMPVPDDFKAHMATVRGWVASAPAALVIGLAAALALTACAVLLARRSARPFSSGGWYAGALAPLAALCALGLWGYIDFNGMWGWLHTTFIPDGIFAASEPVMRLFPTGLFAGYAKPAGIAFAVMYAAILALPAALRPLSRRA